MINKELDTYFMQEAQIMQILTDNIATQSVQISTATAEIEPNSGEKFAGDLENALSITNIEHATCENRSNAKRTSENDTHEIDPQLSEEPEKYSEDGSVVDENILLMSDFMQPIDLSRANFVGGEKGISDAITLTDGTDDYMSLRENGNFTFTSAALSDEYSAIIARENVKSVPENEAIDTATIAETINSEETILKLKQAVASADLGENNTGKITSPWAVNISISTTENSAGDNNVITLLQNIVLQNQSNKVSQANTKSTETDESTTDIANNLQVGQGNIAMSNTSELQTDLAESTTVSSAQGSTTTTTATTSEYTDGEQTDNSGKKGNNSETNTSVGTNVDFSLSEAKSEARVNSAERFDALDKSGTLRTDDVPRYVSKTISQMSDGTTHEATLNLSPETLGKINIKISVSGDTAKILFKVDNSETLKAIENQIGSLKESLQSSGIRVESVGVEQGSTDLLNSDEQRNDAGGNTRKEDEAVRREYLEYVRSNVSDTDLEHSFASFAEQVNISPDEFKELAPQLAEGDEVYGKQFNRKI